MSAPLRAVVVGCGNVGSRYDEDRTGGPPLSHAGAYAAHPDLELVGGVDPSPEARRRFEARWHRPCVASVAEVGRAFGPIDVASLSTPPAHRVVELRALADLGCRAVWCEKPMATTAVGAKALADAAAADGIGLVVNFLRRFDAAHRRVAGWVREEGPVHVDVRFTGDLANVGSHALDLCRWWLGPIADVVASAAGNDRVVAAVTGVAGTGTVAGVVLEDGDVFDVYVWTRRRRVALTRNGEVLAVATAEASPLWTAYRSLGPGTVADHSGLGDAMTVAAGELAALARTGAPSSCGPDDGVAALELDAAVREAAGSGRRIPLR